ncbi:hypothetical protein LEP1GSC089_4130 [Leptospira interrogans serovar Autumnalis str. LP101]|nr:hypothetical protein LEP1GSC089_4130 [Leptospira interrogans serovar Autumnalis str. LP101]
MYEFPQFRFPSESFKNSSWFFPNDERPRLIFWLHKGHFT